MSTEQNCSRRSVPELMREWADVFERKNSNYGNSWEISGETIYQWIFKSIPNMGWTPQKVIFLGLLVRMLDKLLRASNLIIKGEPDKVGEAAYETLADLGVYAFMAASLSRQ